jgi:hypothetical protein
MVQSEREQIRFCTNCSLRWNLGKLLRRMIKWIRPLSGLTIPRPLIPGTLSILLHTTGPLSLSDTVGKRSLP